MMWITRQEQEKQPTSLLNRHRKEAADKANGAEDEHHLVLEDEAPPMISFRLIITIDVTQQVDVEACQGGADPKQQQHQQEADRRQEDWAKDDLRVDDNNQLECLQLYAYCVLTLK